MHVRTMKNITAAVLLVFLFLFTTKPCFLGIGVANIAAANQPVLDTDGDELSAGVEYYIQLQFFSPAGGWLDLGSSSASPCPKFVIQTPTSSRIRRPVVFYPVNTNESVIHESTDVNIVFVPGIDPDCSRTSTAWKIDDYDPSSGRWFVTTGGEVGNPGPQTLTSWFKLVRARGHRVYYIRFCPSVCESCVTLCNGIMRFFPEDRHIRLGLARGNGWLFWFVKASSAIKQVVGN